MVLNRYSRKAATARLAALRRQVSVQVFTLGYEDTACRENRQAAQELAETTNRLSVEVHEAMESGDLLRKYRVDSLPALVITAKEAPEFRVYGVPLGFVLPALLDGMAALGVVYEPKHELLPLAATLVSTVSSPLTLRLDLAVNRRDASTAEAAAALWRATLALYSQSDIPHIVPSLRIIEDFPVWAVRSGDRECPVLFANGSPLISWPFKDSDILESLAGYIAQTVSGSAGTTGT